MRSIIGKFHLILIAICSFSTFLTGQTLVRELSPGVGGEVTVTNHFGRIEIETFPIAAEHPTAGSLKASSPDGTVSASEMRVSGSGGRINIEVAADRSNKRVDIRLMIPERCLVKLETREGAISVTGNLKAIQAKTETGTIAVDVPTDDLSYQFLWTESRPRYVADIDLVDVKELSGGRFSIKGHYGEKAPKEKKRAKSRESQDPVETAAVASDDTPDVPRSIGLNLATSRGIILLNVPPNEVGSDLRERPLTEAAKAIVRSGDSLLMDAIRRSAPKYYGDYARSLPPHKLEPVFTRKVAAASPGGGLIKTALVRVTDLRNRAIAGLGPRDFEVVESGNPRDIVSVENAAAPFNLVLLLDVSGSVENYVDFIRKAARSFVDTVDPKDRVSIIIFNDDIKVLSKFTTDKQRLSDSLDTFDAGGGTAYYDALAYVVADTLRPLKGDRTAIVVLTDGDDNRSFLAFDSLLGSIQESGALIYPLYVPSGLIAEQSRLNSDIDPLRKKYMSLTAKSQGEGEKLAKVSGGVYYPITRIAQIQQAYQDIVSQLRTAYVVKFRSQTGSDATPSRIKIRAKRENSFVTINSVTSADDLK